MSINRKNTVVYPRKFFVEDIVRLKRSGETLNRLVLHQTAETNFWLVSRFLENPFEMANLRRSKQSDELILHTFLLDKGLHPGSSTLETDFLSDAHLYVEIDSKTKPNSISGYLKHKNRIHEIDELYLVGAEMIKIPTQNTNNLFPLKDDYELFLESGYAQERWAMSRKALGDAVWKRLCQLKILIVGCGRSGEMAFMELARLGVGNITICDGDILERRNLGEMKLVTDQDLGRNKAEAVVERVTESRRSKEKTDCFKFSAIKNYNFDDYEAQKAAEESDVIICCVDSDGGRGYASYIAARYYKVLLDIGTGILSSDQTNKIGYDVRLILPDDGCLRCCGGIDEEQSEIEMFNRREQERQRQEGHLNRGGSLSRLNNIAVNKGIKLLQDLCQGTIKNSVWVQYEENIGETMLDSIAKNKSPNCDCEKAGLGNLFL